ncbi:GDSL-type esterase/lipase family protein [Paenibacillus tepidiphilus]|uniref:GDSL-type esterase/lipase family protein n=1 Tax=Paenibacillus tepidiphilus TaxID=2608683 RepID=UPI001239FA84|nr:GDSL-type esterase/lipase family protein [Paenibacillus tepidiphilus]
MNDSKWTWRLVSLSSIATTILLLVGFIYAVSDILYPKGEAAVTSLPAETQTPAAASGGEYRIMALGDSLAKGTGDNTGNGFVKRTVDGLLQDGKARLVGNMGINGLTTAGLLEKLQEEGVRYAMRQANIILLSIGGNDLFGDSGILDTGGDGGAEIPEGASVPVLPGTAAGDTGTDLTEEEAPELTPESLLAGLPEAAGRLGEALQRIAEINPEAHIYYVGLYNPFGDVQELLVPGNQAVTAWNNAVMDLINTRGNMTLVPTFDLFGGHLDKYLSSDHFHPNGDGYQRISERIIQAVR